MVIVGANGASASGNHSITDNSGALNVNISGGNLVANVSGNTISLASGTGPVQVYTSGTTNVVIAASGGAAILQEALADTNSETATAIRTEALLMVRDTGAGAGSQMERAITVGAGDAIGATGLLGTGMYLYNGGAAGAGANNYSRGRTLAGSSGEFLGVLATAPALWKYTEVTAGGITNIFQSGAVALHAVNINDYSSGLSFRVRDSQSGAGGTIVGNVAPFAGGLTVTDIPPATLLYDALLPTGLVVDTSGTGWDLTVLWRNLTS